MPTTYFAVGEVIDLLADVSDFRLGLVVRRAAGNVVVGFRQTDDGALQADEHGVRQCGVVCLRVVAGDLVHPALRGDRRQPFNTTFYFFCVCNFMFVLNEV